MVAPLGPNRSVTVVPSKTTAAEASKVAGDFYAALARGDAKGMAAQYDPQVKFHDPLFGNLKGSKEVMGMWNTIMPAANPKTFKIEPKVQPNPTQNADGSWNVKVHWDAHYDLGKRHVDNHSDSTLTIRNGKIVQQRDDWDLDAWTKQALPLAGGTKVGDAVAHFLAHGFIELKDGWKP
jgi:ketosteroid isomerase-like protein